jgi:XRE family transcriptional regulator, regulator of sulfur utilization
VSDDICVSLGRKIRSLRKMRGWRQEQLGFMAGVSGKFIGQIERGGGNPTVRSLQKIAAALGVEAAHLLTFQEDPRLEEAAARLREVLAGIERRPG